jgi:hypothetical protein
VAQRASITSQRKLPFKFCSGDAIVYRTLGNLNTSEQGIALEEVLQQIGLSRKIDEFQYTKTFRSRILSKPLNI